MEGNGVKLETNNLVKKLILNPGCNNPNNIHTTALIDSDANITLLENISPSNTAYIIPEKNITMKPKGTKMKTRETLQLLLNKIPEPSRKYHR